MWHLPCLPYVYSSVFTYLQHTCKRQICANPFLRPVFNFLHRPVRENPSLPRDTFWLSKDIAPQRCENLKTFVVWWGHVLAPSIQASVKFCNFGNFIILWRSFQWFRRIFHDLSISKVEKTVERYIAMRHSRDSWSCVIWSLTCGSLLEVVVFPSYLPMHIDLEVMFESTVEPRYNEGWKFRRSRLFFIYFRAKRGALGASPLTISPSAKRVHHAWC